ncbi:MAG: ABC transporter ATP-binding protein [Chloroflexota bacterium]|jgi:ATP-binding cassette subfamily B protein
MATRVKFAQYQALLYKYFWPQRLQVALLFVLILLDNAFLLYGPNLLGQFVDAAISGAEASALQQLGVLYLVTALLRQVAQLTTTYVGEMTGWRAANSLRYDLAKHTLGLDMSYHKQQTPGVMIERIDGDVSSLNRFFSQIVLQIGGSILLLVSTVGLLMWLDWRLGLLLLAFTILSAWVMYSLREIAVPFWEGGREASAQLFGFLEERLAGIEDIRGLGASQNVLRRLDALMERKNYFDIRGRVYGSSTWIIPIGLAGLMSMVILGVGSWLYLRGEIGIGLILMTILYGEMIVWPIRNIASEIDQLQQAAAGIVRVAELQNIKSKLTDGQADVPHEVPALSFEDVTFAYTDGEVDAAPVLKNVSFQVPAGQTVGLLGRTGSGKSTLIRLLFRLYDVTSGRITINGTALPDFRLESLRQHVGLVTQDVQLFYATIRDNLTFFNTDISDEQLYAALRMLGLERWLQRQPEGLDTLLTSTNMLSAGEAQLIALARVYLKQPQVIILDEATARIDAETERMVERALDTVLAGKTTIIIAHRLQTVRRCDYIAILSQGTLSEYGKESELRDTPSSRYATLLRHGSTEELV